MLNLRVWLPAIASGMSGFSYRSLPSKRLALVPHCCPRGPWRKRALSLRSGEHPLTVFLVHGGGYLREVIGMTLGIQTRQYDSAACG